MEEIAEQVVRAIEVAMMRAEREARHEERFNAIDKRISELFSLFSKFQGQNKSAST